MLFINKLLTIEHIEILIPGRVILVKTRKEGVVEITNYVSVYGKASGLINEKKAILDSLLHNLIDVNEDYFIIGDYNFVVSALDRNTNRLNQGDIACKSLWHDIETNLNLVDSFRITNKARRLYTYTSPSHTKSRIDRIYVPISVSGNVFSTTFENTDVSDHKIVRTNFKLPVQRGPGNYIINTSLLDDPTFIDGVRNICSDFATSSDSFPNSLVLWDFVKMAIVDFAKDFSYKKSKDRNNAYQIAIKRIDILESISKANLTETHINELNIHKKTETSYMNYKRSGAMLRSKIANFDANEVSLSYLSRLEKIRGDTNIISFLTDDDGILQQGTGNVIDVVNKFYISLYKHENEDIGEQNHFFQNISTRLSVEDKDFLDSPYYRRTTSNSYSVV